jgi:hypothetical protein
MTTMTTTTTHRIQSSVEVFLIPILYPTSSITPEQKRKKEKGKERTGEE